MTYTPSVYPAFYSSLSGIALFHASPSQFPSGPPPKAAPAFSNHCPVILAADGDVAQLGEHLLCKEGGTSSSLLISTFSTPSTVVVDRLKNPAVWEFK